MDELKRGVGVYMRNEAAKCNRETNVTEKHKSLVL